MKVGGFLTRRNRLSLTSGPNPALAGKKRLISGPEVEMVSKDWATEQSLVMQTPGLHVEYSFYGVSLQKESCSAELVEKWLRPAAEFIGRPRC